MGCCRDCMEYDSRRDICNYHGCTTREYETCSYFDDGSYSSFSSHSSSSYSGRCGSCVHYNLSEGFCDKMGKYYPPTDTTCSYYNY